MWELGGSGGAVVVDCLELRWNGMFGSGRVPVWVVGAGWVECGCGGCWGGGRIGRGFEFWVIGGVATTRRRLTSHFLRSGGPRDVLGVVFEVNGCKN